MDDLFLECIKRKMTRSESYSCISKTEGGPNYQQAAIEGRLRRDFEIKKSIKAKIKSDKISQDKERGDKPR